VTWPNGVASIDPALISPAHRKDRAKRLTPGTR
jgi:hypothetical protein